MSDDDDDDDDDHGPAAAHCKPTVLELPLQTF